MSNPEYHLDESLAVRLISNKLAAIDRSRAVRHLLTGCARCRDTVRNIFEIGEWTSPAIFAQLGEIGAFLSSTNRDLDLVEGELLWQAVIERAPKRQRLELLRRPALQTFGVFKAGLAACQKLARTSPNEAVELAEDLVMVVDYVESNRAIPTDLRFDWRADAALTLTRVKRTVGDFRGARAALDKAEAFLALGTQDEVDRAAYFVERGSLQAELGDFEESIETLDRAASLFRFAGDRNSAGKVLLAQAVILRSLDPQKALLLAEEGLTQIDHETETRAELSAHWTMAYCQAELGDAAEAESILATYQYLIEQQDDYVQVIFNLLEARIRYRQANRAVAEQILRGVTDWFLDKGFRLDAVLSTVDLVELLVDDDRIGEALYLVDQVLPVLHAWGLHRDTLAVVSLIREKLETAAIEEGMIGTLAVQLRRTWHKNGRAGLSDY
jgi:tetratricopeptide (TPR) repeat protein